MAKPLELGPCQVCGRMWEVHPQRGVPLEQYLSDPFCSAVCARKAHDNELPPPAKTGRPESSYTK